MSTYKIVLALAKGARKSAKVTKKASLKTGSWLKEQVKQAGQALQDAKAQASDSQE